MHRIRSLSLAVLTSILVSPVSSALSQPFDLPPELANQAKVEFDQSVNAGIIFSTQRAVSSGVFVFEENEDNDVDLTVF